MCRAITHKSQTCTYVNRCTLYRISLTHDGLIKEYGLNANTNDFLLSHVAHAYLPKFNQELIHPAVVQSVFQPGLALDFHASFSLDQLLMPSYGYSIISSGGKYFQ